MLVIFDCDGVLVESEALVAKVYSQALYALGYALSPAECEALLVGKTTPDCLTALETHLNCRLPQGFMPAIDAAAEVVFNQEMQAIPGVLSVLDHLKQKQRPVCVASNGSEQKIKNSLSRCGLLGYFGPNLFSGYSVPKPKPAPDVYLRAAQCMGFAAEACKVVEDSEVGMTAALAANMNVYLYRPPHRIAHFTPPAQVQVITDLQQLIGLL